MSSVRGFAWWRASCALVLAEMWIMYLTRVNMPAVVFIAIWIATLAAGAGMARHQGRSDGRPGEERRPSGTGR